MTVVVDHELLAHPLAANDKAGRPVRAESDDGADDLIGLDARPDERSRRKRPGDRRCGRRASGRATRERETGGAKSGSYDPLASREHPRTREPEDPRTRPHRPYRSLVICAMTDNAISAGVRPPRSRPTGVRIAWIRSSGTPFSRSMSAMRT